MKYQVYRLLLEFETKHDWEEVKGILEEWEEGAIEGYDGADSAFSGKADVDSRGVK